MIMDWRTKFNTASLGTTSSSFPFGFVQVDIVLLTMMVKTSFVIQMI